MLMIVMMKQGTFYHFTTWLSSGEMYSSCRVVVDSAVVQTGLISGSAWKPESRQSMNSQVDEASRTRRC